MPQKILVLSTMLLGDSLLTTGLTRSLRRAYPDSQIDVLVTRNGHLAFNGNPDINNIVYLDKKPSFKDLLGFAVKNWRQYDLVLNDRISDKPMLYTWICGKQRIGFIDSKLPKIRRLFYTKTVDINPKVEHQFYRNMRLLNPVGISKEMHLVAPEAKGCDLLEALPTRYIILHCPASSDFKQWPIDYWQELAKKLLNEGYFLVFTGANSERDTQIVQEVTECLPKAGWLDICGKVPLNQMSLVAKNSNGFVGPDTGPAHLAAGYPIPQVVLFGGTLPDIWAPWPYNYSKDGVPFNRKGLAQSVNNITIIQSGLDCVPCGGKSCSLNNSSKPECLASINAQTVFESIVIKMPLSKCGQ
ncbi:hypothetical protein BCU83_07015 [Vibrio breoganii]|nr:hypothetical protein BCU83_07015 [Vibrio breoganii]PMO52005.1 hypothetical protein BCT07_04350 [Vibrio breoganii]